MPTSSPEDRQARLAKMQAAQRGQERRRSWLVIGTSAVVALLLIGVVVVVIVQSEADRGALESAAEADINGVEEFSDLTQNHVDTPVDYPQTPPVGGDHLAQWQNCGYYADPIQTEAGVHSLEHGAVWIGYDPTLPPEQVETLQALTQDNPYLLVSPVDGLSSPVVASAWGAQLEVDSATDERLSVFLVKYAQGEGTPEPGAPCSGGIGA